MTEMDKLLDDALGHAAVFDCQTAESLCDHVLAHEPDPKTQARAHWIKAVAYAWFHVEYRSDRFAEKLQAEKEAIQRLDPDLLGESLARTEILRAFYPGKDNDVEKTLNGIRSTLLGSGTVDDPPPVSDEDRLEKPLAVYKLGVAYLSAARRMKEAGEERSRQYYDRAAKLLGRAADMQPENYEYGAYYVTTLAELGRRKEAEDAAKALVETFDGRLRYPLVDDQGPFCLYAAVIAQDDPDRAWEVLRKRAKASAAGAWVHYMKAGYDERRAPTVSEQARVWADFVQRLETRKIRMRGSELRVLARAYYRLAHLQSREGDYHAALNTCRKLAAISPHYAELHTNMGLIHRYLGSTAKEFALAKAHFEEARKQFELQLQYDWHGNAIADARRYLEELNQR